MRVEATRDDDGEFEIWIHEAPAPTRTVLFAVGGGGDPRRHQPLLEALAAAGYSVVAPSFERMVGPLVSEEGLLCRGRRLRDVAARVATPNVPLVGIGHSIGGAVLMMMAGARGWLGPGVQLPEMPMKEGPLAALMLMTPPTGFFRGPGSLQSFQLPLLLWAGEQDGIVAPADVAFVHDALSAQPNADVALRVVEGADHFSFMDARPPHTPPVLAHRAHFLETLHAATIDFVEKLSTSEPSSP